MQDYTLDAFEQHWRASIRRFSSDCPDSRDAFAELIALTSKVSGFVAGRRSLATNCTYLLLAKLINHAAATLLLIERGLMVDAALTARNALETALLVELIAKKPDLCVDWAEGKPFTPGQVRRELESLGRVEIGDLAIEASSEEYGDARFVYDWLSRITHANLESLEHTSTATGNNTFVVHIGGEISIPVSVALVKCLGISTVRALATCIAVYEPTQLASLAPRLTKLERSINNVGRSGSV